jgi:protein SCO1/2
VVGALAALIAASAILPPLGPGDTPPPLPLVDQRGAPFSLGRLRGSAVAVSFIYTRCGDARMCPLVSAKFARAQREMGDAPIKLVELTLDPAFDTPAVLARYGRAFGADPRVWTLATGAPSSLDELAARFGIASERTQPGTIVHTEALIVLDPDGRIDSVIDGNTWSPDDLVAAARSALGERMSPLARIAAWSRSAAQWCGRGALALSAGQLLAGLLVVCLVFGGVLLRVFAPLRRDEPHDLVEKLLPERADQARR